MCRSNVIIYQNETKFEIYCNDKTESHHITVKILKVAINTITWVWTKSLIMHIVTFRGIVNVEKIYCDFFSCDFFCYLSCDFLSCDFFSVYHLCIAYIISHLLEEMYENQISILLEISCTPMKNYYLHQWFVVVKSVNGQKVTGQKVTKLLGQKVTGQKVTIYIFYPYQFDQQHIAYPSWPRCRNRIVVWFTHTCAITAYHH